MQRALAFATEAHGSINHVRKYTGEPYINHPIEVMEIVRTAAHHTDEMLAAALLHDTVEDTPVTQEDIEHEFGPAVGKLVLELTDQCHKGNRATRKAAEAARLGTISPEGQTVKLADLISNSRSIVAHDRGFAFVYLREKVRILDAMRDGDPGLYAEARRLVADAQTSIGFRP
ncbi:(p)ppGpp synthase/HD superfamily hydrolase [Novosphingobium chloroacetimidivorans]|uniref:(P)ppGpp synthase/HD superfamily hydrolase n=1 Tax=Novosphingobium chloroacetimidivorans TaxID=1428314 RepID=A0A7W7KCM9_9SPHN|nr:HD domain-containing protein [Novosphingobium chloroacetimidivorans]MBB4859608.1 (p)ppGpp synthase/HD superfamily hydrolase [Novosphingobium chloroacetimidivorans]